MNSAEKFLKAKKKEAMASLGLSTQPQFNQWLRSSTPQEQIELATSLGWVEASTEENETVAQAPVLSLDGIDVESFTTKSGLELSIARMPIIRTSAVTQGVNKGNIIVVCELAGIGEVIVRNSGHIVALVREGIDMVGYKLPIALTGENPVTRRQNDFNGIAQFDGRVVESADENLVGFANAQREEGKAISMLTPDQQKAYHEKKNASKVAAAMKSVDSIRVNALAAFKK